MHTVNKSEKEKMYICYTDDQKGTWKIEAKDVISGKQVSKQFTVR